ncbi:MFS transporter [Ammoniphilus sp. 3BR4]|uniref:MFS transporter n=1 Tax=Ammoniphilus sp. 3BR4 TaxID=3158265 RepID=UPI003467C5CF
MWKRNLIILYVGQFLVNASMSTITPFLPLYLQQLGITDPEEVRLWSSIIFGANLLTAFIISPIWGKLADRYGRKLMLVRSGISMAIIITLMGFATNHIHLLLLRLLNGVMAGYALGILHSGSVAGTMETSSARNIF